jgi:hypothetical protein
MEIKLQTKVNDNNRVQFYQTVYKQQFDTKQQLVDLDMFSNDCVLIDCCGWHYQQVFPNKKIIKLETLPAVLQFKLNQDQFDKLIDNQIDHHIRWPTLMVSNPALIFDRSPILKYRSINDLVNILNDVVDHYKANDLVINLETVFIDDPRFVDRFANLANISILNFTVRKFLYSTHDYKLFIHFKRNCVI